jgi:hypothetical protein
MAQNLCTLAWMGFDVLQIIGEMRTIRKRMLNGDATLTDNARLDLINLTTCLEQTVWMLHKYLCEMMEYPSEAQDD